MDVLVINRDRDHDRWDGFVAAAQGVDIVPRRLPALDAHAPGFALAGHRDLLGTHFWGRHRIKPGAVGCYLSHRAAWAELAASEAPHVLICEDDARLGQPLDRLADAAHELPGFDVIFANDRLAAWASILGPGAHPVPEVVAGLAEMGGPKANGMKPAPGGDCYLLSRRGAVRLLEMTARQQIVCGVDWAMIWSALDTPHGGDAFPELAILSQYLPVEEAPLAAHILTPAVSTLAHGPSVLGHRHTVHLADF